MYIKIIGESTEYNVTIEPFTTQHGHSAVRFVGDTIPTTSKGFMAYNDDDTELSDLSSFVYEYRPNEYSVEEDEQELPSWTDAPLSPSAIDRLNSRVSSLSSRVSSITPYEYVKTVGIDDTECTFGYIPGEIHAWLEMRDAQIPCAYTVTDDQIIVTFEPLEEVAEVHISIS